MKFSHFNYLSHDVLFTMIAYGLIRLELRQSQPYTRSRTSQPPLHTHYDIAHVIAESRNSHQRVFFPIFDNFISSTDDFPSLRCFSLSLNISYQHDMVFFPYLISTYMCVIELAWGQRVHLVPKRSHPCLHGEIMTMHDYCI